MPDSSYSSRVTFVSAIFEIGIDLMAIQLQKKFRVKGLHLSADSESTTGQSPKLRITT